MDKAPSKLVDVSWRFGVIRATSESGSVGQPFLQMTLHLKKDDQARSIFTEMTVAEFYNFVYNLEKAQNDLELLL